MHDFSHLQKTLAEHFKDRVNNIRIVRGNELHFQILHGNALRLAKMLRQDFQAELMLMVANDRRPDNGVFEVHYLFANERENWFAHATKELPADHPTIISMATFYYPASRFEREIKDLFGIQATGSPDRRPLVRHGF
jgi:Ni,Fe-hydrogenase III component G